MANAAAKSILHKSGPPTSLRSACGLEPSLGTTFALVDQLLPDSPITVCIEIVEDDLSIIISVKDFFTIRSFQPN